MNSAPTPISRALSELETATHFLSSKHFEDMIARRLEESVAKGLSPWLDRHAAAAHSYCSPSQIDEAANSGIITRYFRNSTPLFRRDEIDSAILNGQWEQKRRAA